MPSANNEKLDATKLFLNTIQNICSKKSSDEDFFQSIVSAWGQWLKSTGQPLSKDSLTRFMKCLNEAHPGTVKDSDIDALRATMQQGAE